jgi:hypothetical protein
VVTLLKEAEACGASGCATQMPRVHRDLPFRLSWPTIEPGRQSAPPAATDGPHYRVTLTTRPAPVHEVISLDYYPDIGYINVVGEPGSAAGGASLNTGWVQLTRSELSAYDRLAAGLTAFDGEASSSPADGDRTPWAIIGSLVAAAVLAALALLLILRRRAPPGQAGIPSHRPSVTATQREARTPPRPQ